MKSKGIDKTKTAVYYARWPKITLNIIYLNDSNLI